MCYTGMHVGNYAISGDTDTLKMLYISVDRIVKKLKEESPSPVLYYKPQDVVDPEHPSLLEDTFLLVIMTGFQTTLFDARIVCLDSTHKTNQYRFKLLTVVVPDEYRNGNLHTCNINT